MEWYEFSKIKPPLGKDVLFCFITGKPDDIDINKFYYFLGSYEKDNGFFSVIRNDGEEINIAKSSYWQFLTIPHGE